MSMKISNILLKIHSAWTGAGGLCHGAGSHCSKKILSQGRDGLMCMSVRHHNYDGEVYSKTNMQLLDEEDETHTYITAYSAYGFVLNNGFRVLGPAAVFPKAVLSWNVSTASTLTPESLSLFCMLEPKPDVVIIGKGDWSAEINSDIVRFLKSKKINVEILPTEQACSTFNFLNSERRVVVAGLIPPPSVEAGEDFVIEDSAAMERPMPEYLSKDEAEIGEKIKQMTIGNLSNLTKLESGRERSSPDFRSKEKLQAYNTDEKDKS